MVLIASSLHRFVAHGANALNRRSLFTLQSIFGLKYLYMITINIEYKHLSNIKRYCKYKCLFSFERALQLVEGANSFFHASEEVLSDHYITCVWGHWVIRNFDSVFSFMAR